MTKISSRYSGPLSLAGLVTVPPHGTAEVDNWDEIKGGEVVKTWLKSGVIFVGEHKASSQDENGDSPETTALRQQHQREVDDLTVAIAERDATIADLQAKLSVAGSGQGGSPSTASTSTDGQGAGPAYAVKEKSQGWFVVTVDGKDATKSLRKDDVEGFDNMSDEDKAAFVAQNKAG